MRSVLSLVLLCVCSAAQADPWLWQYPGAKYTNALAAGSDGSFAAAFDRRLFMFTPKGQVIKDAGFGPAAIITALTYAPNNDLIVAGRFKAEIDLGGKRFVAGEKSDSDGFVARYGSDGVLRWAVHVESEESVLIGGVATSADRVLVAGWSRYGKAKIGSSSIGARRGFVAVLNSAGEVLSIPQQVDLGVDGEMRSLCATSAGFVVTGWDRRKPMADEGFVRGLDKDGATRWTFVTDHPASGVACRGQTAFVATTGSKPPPEGNYSQDLSILELDGAGRLVRTISIATELDDRLLFISASASEVAVTSGHSDGKNPLWSRVSRFGPRGEAIGNSVDYKGSESIYVHALHTKAGLVLAGEVTRGAKVRIGNHDLVGPAVFVSAP